MPAGVLHLAPAILDMGEVHDATIASYLLAAAAAEPHRPGACVDVLVPQKVAESFVVKDFSVNDSVSRKRVTATRSLNDGADEGRGAKSAPPASVFPPHEK